MVGRRGHADRLHESRPAIAGHPHAAARDAAIELSATTMLLEKGVEVAQEAAHGGGSLAALADERERVVLDCHARPRGPPGAGQINEERMPMPTPAQLSPQVEQFIHFYRVA